MVTTKHKIIPRAVWVIALVFFFSIAAFLFFEMAYKGKIYPRVAVGGIPFGGKTPGDVIAYWQTRNEPFASKLFEFRFNGQVATISAEELDLGYDATLSGAQAYLVGRSPYLFSNIYNKLLNQRINLTPYFRWKTDVLDTTIETIGQRIDIPVQNALFQFKNGKVIAFRPSHDGRRVNREEAKRRFVNTLASIPASQESTIVISLPVDTINPTLTTDRVNAFGIKERIGRGYSEFAGSIPGRVHNIALAASRLNGVLIKPGDIFSFNDALGDISAATGYQSAYIIKDGRTVLGDGGGVCQVSTTLFRAALAAGLPIAQRHAHDYRVHYYEEGGYKPGLDATVFAPSFDLKFKNNTPGYILIQVQTDTGNLSLTFDLYGTNDGRQAQITDHKIWGITPPPPDLYQDDPTLPKGVTKQVDFAAWGTKASFHYRVTRSGELLEDTDFFSDFRPWQAVYLRGTL